MAKGSLLTAALVLSILAAATALGGHQASANGIHPNARDVYAGAVGPYFLRVTTAPFIGTMHFVVYLAQSDGETPVNGAEISLWGRTVGSEEFQAAGPIDGQPSPDGPNLYTVDIPVNEIGSWVFTVSIKSPLEENSVDIPLTVGRRGGVNLGVVGILLILVVLAGLVALSWGRKRRRRSSSRQ